MSASSLGSILVGVMLVLGFCKAEASTAKDASIQQLLSLTQSEKVFQAAGDQFDQLMNQSRLLLEKRVAKAGKKPSAKDQKRSTQFVSEFNALLSEFKHQQLSFAVLQPEMVEVYRNAWSEEEIQDLIRFYETPTGQKAVTVIPTQMQELNQRLQTRLNQQLPQLMKKINALAEKHYPELR